MINAEDRVTSVSDPNHDASDIMVSARLRREMIQSRILAHKACVTAAEHDLEELRGKGRELSELWNNSSPFLALPLDIITEIFDLACRWEDLHGRRLPTQFIIGRICSSWRRIAWSTPRLWQDVTIFFSSIRYKHQTQLLREWLERSTSCLLYLNISLHRDTFSSNWKPPVEIFSILLQTCRRWKHFRYSREGCDEFIAAITNSEQTIEFPELRTLDITGPREPLEEWPFNFPPKLDVFDISCTGIPHIAINWAHLTRLEVTCSTECCVTVIRLCHSLVNLSFFCSDTTGEDDMDLGLVEYPHNLPFLSKLVFSGDTHEINRLMRNITTPSLETIAFDLYLSPHWTTDSWMASLIQMTHRSNCKISNVSFDACITPCALREEQLCDLVSAVPSIQKIDFTCIDTDFVLSNRTIDLFNLGSLKDDAINTHAPKLSLFRYRGNISFDLRSLLHMVQSRGDFLKSENSMSRGCLTVESSTAARAVPETFCVDIGYTQDSWFQQMHPNEVHDFYHDLHSKVPRNISVLLKNL